VAKKRGKSAKKSAKRKVTRKLAKKSRTRADARRPARRAAPKAPAAPAIRLGIITHTELASADPEATKAWCTSVLGWKFGASVPTPSGPYHMYRFDNNTGGGIRGNNPPEVPGSIPYCEVADIRATYERALAAGGTEMVGPMQLPDGMGWIAIVAAPGGVPIGFWAMK
jgi:predicted enzyme related to lactoylglutathione lyase